MSIERFNYVESHMEASLQEDKFGEYMKTADIPLKALMYAMALMRNHAERDTKGDVILEHVATLDALVDAATLKPMHGADRWRCPECERTFPRSFIGIFDKYDMNYCSSKCQAEGEKHT